MQKYQYKVIPMSGLQLKVTPTDIEEGRASKESASQFESILEQNAKEGWDFYRAINVEVHVEKGCGYFIQNPMEIFKLFRSSPNELEIPQLIFRKQLK
jgi:hypothetical protein